MLYFLFVPFNIMALSYNSIGLACNFLCTVFLITADNKKYDYVLSGIFFAMMVLCQPILCIIFFIDIVIILICAKCKKKKELLPKIMYFFLGCIIMAISVVLYLVTKVGIHNIISIIPQILNDPEHRGAGTIGNLFHRIVRLYISEKEIIISQFSINTKIILKILYAMFVLVGISTIVDKLNRRNVKITISALVATGISCCYLLFIQSSYINFLIFPGVLHGITLFLLEKNKQIRTVLKISWLIDFSHAIAFLGSNQYGYVFNIALLSAGLISILLNLQEKATKKIIGICVLITFCLLGYARTEHVFRQTPPSTLTEQCSEGSVKGIYVTKETKKFYDERVADIKEKNITSKDNVLFLTQDTFLPLEITAPVAQYSC